jgi:hypothetical protein
VAITNQSVDIHSEPIAWYRTISREQWNTLIAAQLGWTLDALDFVLYLMAIKTLMDAFGFSYTPLRRWAQRLRKTSLN